MFVVVVVVDGELFALGLYVPPPYFDHAYGDDSDKSVVALDIGRCGLAIAAW